MDGYEWDAGHVQEDVRETAANVSAPRIGLIIPLSLDR
jgi:hypothetical protein